MATSDFIDSIIAAHGGLERFKSLTTITVTFNFGGSLLAIKQRHTQSVATATVFTREQKVIYRGLGGSADEEWVYTPSKVWKQSVSSNKTFESRDHPRQAFDGHTRQTPWDDLHLTHFAGYAFWQYIQFPYLLTRDDVTARELDPHVESGGKWRVLEVEFPPQNVLPSHSLRQKYYFDEKFMLCRHDYTPEVLGGTSLGAHYSFDQVDVGGLKFPTLRRAVSRKPETDEPVLFGPYATSILLVFRSIVLRGENGEEVASWKVKEAPLV